MFGLKRLIVIATAIASVTPAAAATANSRLVSYEGKTKEGTKISFVVDRGYLDQFETLLPTTCITVHGATPRVDFTEWRIPFKYQLGVAYRFKYGDPTKYYAITTHRQGSQIVGKLSMDYSLLGADAFSNYVIWHCLATASFDLRPR